jgi:hypothetical protein
MLEDKLIVGNGLDHDIEVLRLFFPKKLIRNTAGGHSSVEDAQAALKLYLKYRDDW